jgi:signal transduction histidine kinase
VGKISEFSKLMAAIHLKKISWEAPKHFSPKLLAANQSVQESFSVYFLETFFKAIFPQEFSHSDLKNSDSLRASFLNLRPSQRKLIIKKFGEENLQRCFSIGLENQRQIFNERVFSLAQQLQRSRTTLPYAFKLFQHLKSSLQPSTFQTKIIKNAALLKNVQRELNIYEGKAPFLQQLAHHLSYLQEDLTDPILYAGFFSATAALHSARTLALSTLVNRFTPNIFTRGWAASGISSLIGVSAETTALTATTRGLRNLLDPNSIHASMPFATEWLATGVTLGLFHSAGALANKAHILTHIPNSPRVIPSRLTKISAKLFPQTAMLGALYFGNYANSHLLHLKPEQTRGALAAESLSSYFFLNLAGKTFDWMQPEGFKNLTRALQEKAKISSETLWSPGINKFKKGWREIFVPKVVYATETFPKRPELILMEDKDRTPIPLGTYEVIRPTPRAIKIEQALWLKIFQQAPHPILLLDPGGYILKANRKANTLFARNLNLDTLDGQNLGDLFETYMATPNLFKIRGANESSSIFHAKIDNADDPGELKIYYFQDVTEILAKEKENKQLKKQLQHLGFLESQLKLLQSIIHDTSNTLTPAYHYLETTIEALIEVAKASPNPEEMKTIIEQIKNSVAKSVNLILSIKPSMRTRLTGEFKRFSFHEMLREIINLDQKRFDLLGIKVQNEMTSSGLHFFLGDELQLFHAIYNLTKNASEAMPRGGILTLRARAETQNIVIEIEDTGSGISKENLAKIFDDAFTTKKTGTGLGLFFAHETIKQHGGSITVKSDPGRGTQFTITLPKNHSSTNTPSPK